jgi:tetratricopeptide (TPR) repeat protein
VEAGTGSVTASVPGTRLLGRERERQHLLAALERARGGVGGLALLAGEPGIGKSSLAADAAATAAGAGVVSLWATCWQGDGTPPFWPWIQVLRQVRREVPAAEVARAFSPVAPALGPLAAELDLGEGEEGGERFRVFDAMTRGLLELAATTPLLIVLDDLHWADAPSLQLLDFLGRNVRHAAVLVIGTYRDVDLPDDHPLHDLVGLAASQVAHLQLAGLDTDAVAEMLARTSHEPPTPDLVAQVAADSGGNPFFVRELGNLLAGRTGDQSVATLPHNVRQVVRDRVERMPHETAAALARASVIGVTFSAADLGGLCDISPEDTLGRLQPALAARLVRPAERGARLRFVHALVPEVLYADLAPPRRAELHARHARRIEAAAGERPDTRIEELAHHFARAVPVIDASVAVTALTRAAQQAIELLAYEQAITHYEQALEFQALTDTEPAERARLLHALAQAQNLAAMPVLAMATRREAARLARLAAQPDLLAQIGLETGEPFVMLTTDDERVAILEDALSGLPQRDDPTRAVAMAGLGAALLFTDQVARKEALFDSAVAMARRLDDPATLARVLAEQAAASWIADAARRLGATTEVVALAEQVGDRRLSLRGRIQRIGVLLELGDGDTLRVEIDAFERLATAARLRVFSRVVPLQRVVLAGLAGDWLAGEALLDAAAATYRSSGQATGRVAVAIATRCLRFAQGRGAELHEELAELAPQYPASVALQASAAFAAAAAGRTDEARAVLSRLAPARLAETPRDFTWLAGVALAGQAAVACGDQSVVRVVRELLQPFGESIVPFSRTATAELGPAGYTLGLAAEASGEPDAAVAAYEAAIDTCRRLGAPVFAADSQYALARTLRSRRNAGDLERADSLAAEATATAGRVGVALPLNGVAPPPASAVTAPAPVVTLAAVEVPTATREGDVWALTYAGATVRVRDSTGLGHLTRLLANPGAELHVLDLAAGQPRRSQAAARSPVLDDAAKAEYRRRIDELRAEVAEATEWNDQVRAAKAEAELDALTSELRRAVGLGGRDRPVADEAERARFAVSKAMRTAIRRIAEHHPQLGAHLARSVRTGTFCTYTADVRWQVTR